MDIADLQHGVQQGRAVDYYIKKSKTMLCFLVAWENIFQFSVRQQHPPFAHNLRAETAQFGAGA